MLKQLCLAVFIVAAVATVSAFAGKRVDKSGASVAKTVKGFGKAPLTLAETLATFKTRVPFEAAESQPCPCGLHGKVYGDCCAPYHQGKSQPQSPLAVLQSRYSAFCWRHVGYIIESTHPTCRDYREDKIAWANDLDKRGMFDSFDFIGLTVLGDGEIPTEVESVRCVEFQVQIQSKRRAGSTIEGQVTTIQELSTFLRDDSTGTWTYASGDVRSTVPGVEDVKLNP